jgi:hypothetical protein
MKMFVDQHRTNFVEYLLIEYSHDMLLFDALVVVGKAVAADDDDVNLFFH